MTQRYTTSDASAPARSYDRDRDYDKYAVTAPLDSVRWAAVLAGLFAAFSAVIVLTVLGLAIGLSTFDASDTRNFGIGAGVFGAVTALIAFAVGGFIASRTAAVTGSSNAILNGAMVWIVALPLIVNLLGTGIGSILGTATDVATTAVGAAAQVAAPAVASVADEAAQAAQENPELAATAEAIAGDAAASAQAAVADVQEQIENIEPEEVTEVVRDVSGAAWGTLLVLGLTAAASILGGVLGRRSLPTEVVSVTREEAR